ncbi:hypothetical protein Bca52824_068675 [Brassica carinata]|uniref:Uncharacterized protein n=1 Tax=Brassica carinata TaxID=52824 RepID=A0A8X7Q0S9_BRACI|nr:hypothetical protein Bca52824_068675 [Brassica carinata]
MEHSPSSFDHLTRGKVSTARLEAGLLPCTVGVNVDASKILLLVTRTCTLLINVCALLINDEAGTVLGVDVCTLLANLDA